MDPDAASHDPDGRGVQDIIPNNTNVSPIGIDTVRIHLGDFAVGDTADFKVYNKSDYPTGETDSVPLWKASDGTPITGSKATLNTSTVQVTVRSVDFMSVQASLPKLLRGNNRRPAATPDECSRALTTLESQLEEQGIHCSLSGKPLGRVDICRNVRTEIPLADLEPHLKHLDAPYLEPRDNGYGGVKWVSLQSGRSSDREVTLYNKSGDAGLSDPNIQRLEYRLQRKRVVESKLDESTTADLTESLTSVRSAFRRIVTELFPKSDDGSGDGDSNESSSGDSSSGDISSGDGGSKQGGAASNDTCGEPGLITSTQIRGLLRKIRSEHGDNCHALNRAMWPLLLATHPDPDHLADALERAAASEDGPTRGKYKVRKKAREARGLAQELSGGLTTSAERLKTLRAKLLS